MSSESASGGTTTSTDEKARQEGFERWNVLVLSLLTFCLTGFGVWLVSAGKAYREQYAQATETWRVGSTREVELTVVKNDKRNLSCASDQTIAGLHCGYRRNGREAGRVSPDDAQMLQPYNTTSNQLLLGAGLWTAEELKEPLPEGRFTVVCNYHIKGIMKSAAVRFDPHASFSAVGKTVTAGSLTECVLPR
jgi:hypothetical protein